MVMRENELGGGWDRHCGVGEGGLTYISFVNSPLLYLPLKRACNIMLPLLMLECEMRAVKVSCGSANQTCLCVHSIIP